MKKIFVLIAAVMTAASMVADTVYFVNKAGWSAPNCYAWNGAGGPGNQNNNWPGVAMQKESYQLGGADVYSYTADPAWENCIFNGGGNQTADLSWQSGLYYDGSNWQTREALENGGKPTTGGGGTTDGNPRYYWKGFVDGEDVEPTDATLFTNGTAAISVASDAYLFVIYQVDGQMGVEYMTEAYADGVTHATLYVTGKGKYEKLHVGAGDYTLYLYDNGDGSLELSTEQLPGKTLVSTGASALNETAARIKAHKVLIDGRICLQAGSHLYDAQGKRMN